MSRARLYLHCVALIAPFTAAATFACMVDRDADFILRMAGIFGGVGALSAQIAALLRWRALERRARAGSGGWITGIGMAAITHVLFGVLAAIGLAIAAGGWRKSAGSGSPFDIVVQALFFMLASILPVGIVTVPATGGFAEWIARLRSRELADVRR